MMQANQPVGLQGLNVLNIAVDFSSQRAFTGVNNGTLGFGVYTDGMTKRTWVNILTGPGAGMCVNGTYDDRVFQNQKLCVGPDAPQFNTFASEVTFAGALMGESWASKEGQYINVNPANCYAIGTASFQPGNQQLGILFDISPTFDPNLLKIPANCQTGADAKGYGALAAKLVAETVAQSTAGAVLGLSL